MGEDRLWRPAGGQKIDKLVKAKRDSRDLSAEGHSTASRSWVGRRPEGPGSEPDGKDFTLFFTLIRRLWEE